MTKICVPDSVRNHDFVVIASVSGGKDSTAMMLALREADVPFRAVFADTGWEAPQTYDYLDLLREKIGPISTVSLSGGMVARSREKLSFPTRLGRWCTEDLKLRPLEAHLKSVEAETGKCAVAAVGVRAQESEARRKLPSWEDSSDLGSYVWRPILEWTIQDVLAIHHRHKIPVNPLYRIGHNRVGCYPCIFSQKEEMRLISKLAPWRINEIDLLEKEFTTERAKRNQDRPGRYASGVATFFQPILGRQRNTIKDVARWSQTDRGGRQMPLLQPPPTGGCMRWGMCEPPTLEASSADPE